MDKMLANLSLYEQLGFIAVGGTFALLVGADALVFGIPPTDIPWPSSLASQAIIVYFLGHCVQAMANVLAKENPAAYRREHLEILKRAARGWRMKPFDADEAFQRCYLLALAHDETGQVKAFNANYGLYRGWYVAFALNTAFFAIVSGFSCYRFKYVAAALASAAVAALMRSRAKRYYSYLRVKTLLTFELFAKRP